MEDGLAGVYGQVAAIPVTSECKVVHEPARNRCLNMEEKPVQEQGMKRACATRIHVQVSRGNSTVLYNQYD